MRLIRLCRDTLLLRIGNRLLVTHDPDEDFAPVMCQFRAALAQRQERAIAALAMSQTQRAAAQWWHECNEAHIGGDCPLCGAE